MAVNAGRNGTFYVNTGRRATWHSLPFNALVMGEDCDCGASWTKVAVEGPSETYRLDVCHPGDALELNCPSCGDNKGETLVLRNWYVLPV